MLVSLVESPPCSTSSDRAIPFASDAAFAVPLQGSDCQTFHQQDVENSMGMLLFYLFYQFYPWNLLFNISRSLYQFTYLPYIAHRTSPKFSGASQLRVSTWPSAPGTSNWHLSLTSNKHDFREDFASLGKFQACDWYNLNACLPQLQEHQSLHLSPLLDDVPGAACLKHQLQLQPGTFPKRLKGLKD